MYILWQLYGHSFLESFTPGQCCTKKYIRVCTWYILSMYILSTRMYIPVYCNIPVHRRQKSKTSGILHKISRLFCCVVTAVQNSDELFLFFVVLEHHGCIMAGHGRCTNGRYRLSVPATGQFEQPYVQWLAELHSGRPCTAQANSALFSRWRSSSWAGPHNSNEQHAFQSRAW